jgi:hypothetical protein
VNRAEQAAADCDAAATPALSVRGAAAALAVLGESGIGHEQVDTGVSFDVAERGEQLFAWVADESEFRVFALHRPESRLAQRARTSRRRLRPVGVCAVASYIPRVGPSHRRAVSVKVELG